LPAGADFEYDVSKWEVGKVQPTEQLAAVLKDYGGFPDSVLVRQEMKILWGVLVEKMVEQKFQVAVVGSPGVGKSVLVVLFGLFLANAMRENIFLLRAVKTAEKVKAAFAVICFRGPNKIVLYSRLKTIDKALEICDIFENDCLRDNETYRIVIDGMNQDELSLTVLSNFDLLATSAQYDRKNDDPHKLCVLPAWQKPDLKLYATQLMNPAVSSETFDHYYEHSGGSADGRTAYADH
jgi:hypothetical protein